MIQGVEIPSGMTTVSKDQFFSKLLASGKDVMPKAEWDINRELYSEWRVSHTHSLWGWSHSDGRFALTSFGAA